MQFPFITLSDYFNSKIIDAVSLKKNIDEVRASNKKEGTAPTIATLNGSFDLLHSGHLYIVYEAAQTADILVVALNSDASIKRYKSSTRPFIPLQYRMEMVAALSFVDFVTWFEEDDPRALITLLQPDVHVNGKEYGENCIEADTVRKIGGKLHLVDRIPGLATSEIIYKIQALP